MAIYTSSGLGIPIIELVGKEILLDVLREMHSKLEDQIAKLLDREGNLIKESDRSELKDLRTELSEVQNCINDLTS